MKVLEVHWQTLNSGFATLFVQPPDFDKTPNVNPYVLLAYLPPYSPDCNPIEMAFAKLKALLRKAAARTVDDLWDAIAEAIDAFTSTKCENYFAAAGYDRD